MSDNQQEQFTRSFRIRAIEEDAMSLENLISDLKNGLGMIRVNAAAELGKLKDKEAERALIEALGDENMAVRNNAAFSLGELGSHEAVPRLIALFSDPEERVRKSAVKALGMIGTREATGPLVQLLAGDQSSIVKRSAIRSLGQIGGTTAMQAIEPFTVSPDGTLAAMAKQVIEKSHNR
jgi:HEAT repeat protein